MTNLTGFDLFQLLALKHSRESEEQKLSEFQEQLEQLGPVREKVREHRKVNFLQFQVAGPVLKGAGTAVVGKGNFMLFPVILMGQMMGRTCVCTRAHPFYLKLINCKDI